MTTDDVLNMGVPTVVVQFCFEGFFRISNVSVFKVKQHFHSLKQEN